MIEPIAEKMMDQLFTEYWKKVEAKRVKDAQKLWYWYYNEKNEVINYIKNAMRTMFRPKTINKMNIRALVIVDRIISRLAKVYKKPASRMLDGGFSRKTDDTGKQIVSQSDSDKIYQDVLSKSTINKKISEAEKLLILFNTILVQPIFRTGPDEQYFDFAIHTPAWTVVESDEVDWLKPLRFYFPTWATINGKYQQVLVYWDQFRHFYIDRFGNPFLAPGMMTFENPYQILPVAVARIKEGNDFWGEGKWSLVDGNEEVCIQANNIFYSTIWQTHGQAISINMGLSKEPETGPDSPIVTENADDKTKQASSFSFANASPMVTEVKELIDWIIKLLHGLEGITGYSVSLDPAVQSGVSKIQDSAELQESREGMLGILEEFEHDLFKVMRVIWNYHNPTRKISEKSEFSVHFAEPKILKSIDDKIKERKSALNLKTASRIDFIMEDHPEMNREQAEQKLRQILDEERMFQDKYGIMDIVKEDDEE